MPSASTAAARGASRSIQVQVGIGSPVSGSTPSAAQWPSPPMLLVRDRALEHEHERVQAARRPRVQNARMNSSPLS